MIYFTKYSEQKFDILNKHKVYFTREDVLNTIKVPDKIKKKGKNFIYLRDGMAVILKNEEEITKIITFYPIK